MLSRLRLNHRINRGSGARAKTQGQAKLNMRGWPLAGDVLAQILIQHLAIEFGVWSILLHDKCIKARFAQLSFARVLKELAPLRAAQRGYFISSTSVQQQST